MTPRQHLFNVEQILVSARNAVAAGWVQGKLGEKKHYEVETIGGGFFKKHTILTPSAEPRVTVCSVGAINYAGTGDPRGFAAPGNPRGLTLSREIVDAKLILTTAIRRNHPWFPFDHRDPDVAIIGFNDAQSRTQDEVLAAFDAAISDVREKIRDAQPAMPVLPLVTRPVLASRATRDADLAFAGD